MGCHPPGKALNKQAAATEHLIKRSSDPIAPRAGFLFIRSGRQTRSGMAQGFAL
jgi:hypothetical protein